MSDHINENRFIQNKTLVSLSPHIRSNITTQKIMIDVVIALCPALIASAIFFGARSLIVTASSVLFCVLFEFLFNFACKKKQHINDFSAVVTGILLAFNLPVTIPIPIVIIGAFIAIVIVKMLFGGIGQNFANPAITARIVLFVSFASFMTNYSTDTLTSATPLYLMANGQTDQLPSILDMFLGAKGGVLGETSFLAIMLGGLYLVVRRVITVLVPLTYIGGVFVFALLFGADPIYHVLSGGLALGAVFMATDYTTSPTSNLGKFIFALGCALLTMVIRLYASYPEGVSFAILIMNILTPHIDNLTAKRVFGINKKTLK